MSFVRLPNDDLYWLPRPASMNVEEYVTQRNAVLMSGDWRNLKSWALRMGATAPTSDLSIEIAFNQLITAVPSLPLPLRQQAKQWLTDRGYHSLDDGELDAGVVDAAVARHPKAD